MNGGRYQHHHQGNNEIGHKTSKGALLNGFANKNHQKKNKSQISNVEEVELNDEESFPDSPASFGDEPKTPPNLWDGIARNDSLGPILVPHDQLFAQVPGRLSLLSNVVKYKVNLLYNNIIFIMVNKLVNGRFQKSASFKTQSKTQSGTYTIPYHSS